MPEAVGEWTPGLNGGSGSHLVLLEGRKNEEEGENEKEKEIQGEKDGQKKLDEASHGFKMPAAPARTNSQRGLWGAPDLVGTS